MKSTLFTGIAIAALCVSLAGCKKKTPVAAVPRPPAAADNQSAPVTRASEPAPAPSPTEVAAAPSARMPDDATRGRIQDLLNRIEDAYFDYDKHNIRPDAESTLKTDVQKLSDIIRQYPDFKLTVEGYCDERGSDEYNLALGEARAKQALEFMVGMGIPANQMRTVSFGRENPVCTDHDENCWQKNRRAHITQSQS